jgi:hypothetical protein
VVAWVDDVNGSGKCLRWSEVWGVEGRWPPEARAGGWSCEVGCNTAFCFTSFWWELSSSNPLKAGQVASIWTLWFDLVCIE